MKMEDIADDVWFEICLHLPLDSIFKFRSVSKVWFSILSSPNFINKWYKLNHSSLPWALVGPKNFVEDNNYNKLRRYFTLTYPDSHSSQHQNGFSFSFLDPDFTDSSNDQQEMNLFLLGSSNGLVLCTPSMVEQNTHYVCNPLTKKWISLPPPPQGENTQIVTAFICNECFSESTSFKIIRMPKFKDAAKEFRVEVFCSDLGEWNVYDISCPLDATWEFFATNDLVTHDGVFYWFRKEISRILAVSFDRNNKDGTCGNECRLINLPDRAVDGDTWYHHRLGESEGLVCYAIIKSRERSLSVWVLQEDWCLLYKDDKFYDTVAEMESLLIVEFGKIDLITRIRILGFNPVDKDVVILGYEKYVWAYNTRTKGYEQLSCTSDLISSFGFLTFTLKLWPTVFPAVNW